MKKTHWIILVLAIGLFVGVNGLNQSAMASDSDWKWPKMLISMDTNVAAPTYVLAISWTPLHGKEVGVKWRVLAEASSNAKVAMLKKGEADFWWNNLQSTAEILEGNGLYATREGGPGRFRVGHQGFVQMSGLMVLADSGIKTIKDIKPGTRYSIPIGTAVMTQYYDAFRAWFQMSEEELIKVPFGSFPASSRALAEGRVDITFNDPASIFAREIEAGPHGVHFLDFPESDKEGFARFQEQIPTITFDKVRHGVKGSEGVRMMKIRFQGLTMADKDPEMIYRLVKWLDQNHDKYKHLNWNAPGMNLYVFRDMMDMTFIPLHEGVIRYMKEIGKWGPADDVRQEYNVKLVDMYTDLYAQAIKKADQEGISVGPQNEDWMALWNEFKKKSGFPRFRIMSDEQIAAALPDL